ncbi:UNVERIFIED_CONTAM: Transcription initiation factor TFIID subunit 9B [Siphonaria sp. JEL0065]|nr:Transcription initiation factor TFIID subunit 9B [Siphonaria sp. JEL0065]
MDVNDYHPAVLPQLMDFMHRYTLDVVGDAQLFAEYAGRTEVDVDDVKLAPQMPMGFGGAPQPSSFMFGGMGGSSFNPNMMNMNMSMNMGGMNFNAPGGFMGMMGVGGMAQPNTMLMGGAGGTGQPMMMNPMMSLAPSNQRQNNQMDEDDYDD